METKVPITNELERWIADAFHIFDHIGDDTIEIYDVGNVLRFMGCAPTEQEINKVIAETQSDHSKGEVYLGKFMQYVSQLLFERKMEPASPEKLLEAFEVLDPELSGFLTKEYISKLMLEEGECLTQEELHSMLSVAIDPRNGKVPYEFYLNQLKHNPRPSVFDIAEALFIEQEKKAQAKAGSSKYKDGGETYDNEIKNQIYFE